MLTIAVLVVLGFAPRVESQGLVGPDTVVVASGSLKLRALLWRPQGKGPFPAVLFSHGSALDSANSANGIRGARNRERGAAALGPIFARRGYVFLYLFRRGAGLSAGQGKYSGDLRAAELAANGQEAHDRLQIRLLEGDELSDALAGLAYLRSLPEVDAGRVAAVGHSFGGSLTLLIAEHDSTLRAVVDFASAAGSWRSVLLRERLRTAVSRTTVPTFFIHASNDYSIEPGKSLAADMERLAKPHRLRIYPAFGLTPEEGHNIVYRSTATWEADVFAFLDTYMRPPVSPSAFAVSFGNASSAAASDVHFTSGRSVLKIPFRLYNNHIYLQVAVNGSAPLWFVLDTGARNLIASRHAKALGLQFTLAPPAVGSGERTQHAFTTDNVSLALPGMTLTRQKLGVLDFEELEACSNEIDVDPRGSMTKRRRSREGNERQPFDGVLGDELFRLFVVELDFDAQVMSLHDRQDYRYTGQGEAIPLEVRPRFAYVRTQLASSNAGSVAGLFLIDTGFMGALLLHKPFIDNNGMLPPDDETTPFDLCGIGGASRSRMGELESLRLGRVHVKSPVTLFSRARDGNLISAEYDGIIGNAILRRFTVVFDYARSRMILDPRQ